MRRLSVLTVTRKRRRRRRSIGCSSIDGAAPVCTFEVGHISSGPRVSRTVGCEATERHPPVGPHHDVADQVVATAILDRLLHRATVINIKGQSYRMRAHVPAAHEPCGDERTPPPARRHGLVKLGAACA